MLTLTISTLVVKHLASCCCGVGSEGPHFTDSLVLSLLLTRRP